MHSAGDDLVAVEVADARAARELAERLRATGFWLEAVAGVDSVMVQFDATSVTRKEATAALAAALDSPSQVDEGQRLIVEVPVVYGGDAGPDFDYVCKALGLTAEELIDLHTGEYIVDTMGFTPGFAYIGGLDQRLVIDRLEHPRQHVPAGSVGIAGGRTGLYSLDGPGGWPLIGKTTKPLFDAKKTEPFTLDAGAQVIFSAVDRQ